MMNWQQLLSTQRFKKHDNLIIPTTTPSTQEGIHALRTDFHIDYDRIVFSSAFRRLGRKTQVHPFAKHDHIHNRLTHSVEVASVGRSLGNRVGIMMLNSGFLPPQNHPSDIGSIVQVACLAHDFGNPPFGHSGEDALRAWFRDPAHQHWLSELNIAEQRDIQTYEGNAHSLRLVASLEMYRNQGGMRLTAATIGTLMKYPWTSIDKQGLKKFNIYQTELPFIQAVAAELQLPEQSPQHWVRHPLSYLMEAADDICYALLDLEDAVEIGLLHELEVESILSKLTYPEITWQAQSSREKCAMLRGIAIGRAIEDIAQTFMTHHDSLINGDFAAKDLISLASPEVQETLTEAKELAKARIFRHPSKLLTEIATFPCLGSILGLLIPAAHTWIHQQPLSAQQTLALELLAEDPITQHDTLYSAYMKILDFVGNMTDNSAARLAREVSGSSMVA